MTAKSAVLLTLVATWVACGDGNGTQPPILTTAGAPAEPAGPAATPAGPSTPMSPASTGSSTPPARPVAPSAGAAGAAAASPVAAMSGSAKPAPAVAGPPGLAVDSATGELVFRTEPLDLQAGEESYTCYGITLEQDVVVDGFTKSSQPFVHHAQFFEALWPEPEGKSICKEQFKLTWLPIFLAGAGASELRFDEGIGHVIPAGTQLVLQMHLFNSTDKVQTQPVEIRMHLSKSKNPTPVAPWAIGSSQINIPARQAGSAQNVCTMHGSVDLIAVFPHMHMLGQQFKVEVGPSMDAMKPLYVRDPYDFDDQRMEKVKISLKPGDLLRVTCNYMNTTDNVVTFGESSTEEMCFFVGFAVGDAPEQADCPNLWEALLTL